MEHMTRDKEDRYCVAAGLTVTWQGRGQAEGQQIKVQGGKPFFQTPFWKSRSRSKAYQRSSLGPGERTYVRSLIF